MATSTFAYATQSDFKSYFPHLTNVGDDKSPIYNWVITSQSNTYVSHDTGLVTALFVDGAEQTLKQSDATDVDATGKWYYDSGLDALYYNNSSSDPNNLLTESGSDFTTYFNNQTYKASMELNNMLDARFNTPIKKTFIYSNNPSSDDAQYDALIIKITCYIIAINILRGQGDYEQANILYEQITNTENSGMIDKLNSGIWKLSFEVDKKDSSGDIIEITRNGSMHLVETYGEWTGLKYDRIQLICTTGGAYGTAKMSIKTHGGDALFGATGTDWEVTGGLDAIGNGLYVRFEGNSMNVGDRWDIEVRNYSIQQTNKQGIRTIDAIRNDLSPSRIRRK